MLLHDLMHNFCHPEAKLETLALPSTLKMEDRERFEEVKNAESLSTMIHNALTSDQYELARTLYMQWSRKAFAANNIVQLPTRESSPRKQQKMGGASLFRGASLVEGVPRGLACSLDKEERRF
jgi:hypothetical protein